MKVIVACVISLACCVGLAFSQFFPQGGSFYGPLWYDLLGPVPYLLTGAATGSAGGSGYGGYGGFGGDGGSGQESIFFLIFFIVILFGMNSNGGGFGFGNNNQDQVILVNNDS